MVFASKFRDWPGDGFRLTFLPQMIKSFIYIYKRHIYDIYIYKDFIKYPTEMKT